MLQLITDFIPRLVASHHKGSMGRLAVVGGSKEYVCLSPFPTLSRYTGAPYFAGISALHCGADLVHIICAAEAASVIKTYSPDLIVHPNLSDETHTEVKKWIDKCHAVLVGPGLGLGDNLRGSGEIGRQPTDSIEEPSKLAAELGGLTVIRKGAVDVISNGKMTIVCDEEGSPRRCGGQGDLLSGMAVTFLNWFTDAASRNDNLPFPVEIGAAFAACTLTRRCSKLAYAKYGRSMVTAQIIPEIQHGFRQLFG